MSEKSDEVNLGNVSESHTHSVYNPAQTVRLKSPPKYLEDFRHKDPQGTIDYLYQRKEAYKAAGLKQYHRANAAEKRIKELEAELDKEKKHDKRIKAKLKEETAMKNWWRYAALTFGVGMFMLFVIVLVVLMTGNRGGGNPQAAPKMPVSGMAQRTPSHVLASVNIFNGDVQGSGVVVSKGDKHSAVLSAGHNFKGNVGGEFWVYYADGTYTKATLLAVDRERDLALARVDSKTILGHSYIPKAIFRGEITGVGYTGGQGPNLRKLVYNSAYYNTAKKYMWDFSVREGPFWDGDSGSGVFIDDATVGITSQRDALVPLGHNTYQRKLYACSHDEIVRFLTVNKDKLEGCGDYTVAQEIPAGSDGSPPLWKPNPNVPIYTESRVDKMLTDLRADVDALKKQANPGLQRPSEIKEPELKRPSEIK